MTSKCGVGTGIAFFLGIPRDIWSTSETLHWAADWKYARWEDKELPLVKLRPGVIHHFAIQQKNGRLRVFIDGKRVVQKPVGGGITGKRLPHRDGFSFDLHGVCPAEGKEILITNIKVTEY